jgi:hypothetical protein
MPKQQHSESGRRRGERRRHDSRERTYEEHTETVWASSSPIRIAGIVIAVAAIVGVTALFVAGVIKW